MHEKLKETKDLLHLDIDYVTEHFAASRFSYSVQALPVNVLLDTLIRPQGETENSRSCVKWVYDPSRCIKHAVVGNTVTAGGQWVDNPVHASWDIGTLSYAGMLSLPGYSFEQYYKETYGQNLPFYSRPTRREVAGYLGRYPEKVKIADAVYNDVKVSGIGRVNGGFQAESHGIFCKHLVVATGIFSNLIPPRSLLHPLATLSRTQNGSSTHPVMIVGSGFSAADVIISTSRAQSIIHIFKWNPPKSPSPLRACHQQAYPEYAGVYRRMKLAALGASTSRDKRPRANRKASSSFDESRDWEATYEGLPNTEIIDVRMEVDRAVVTLRNDSQGVFEKAISSMAYVVGRRGSLSYLRPELRHELGLDGIDPDMISGQTLRERANEDLEMAPDVFITGSLTGDSLIRFAIGSCTYAAGKIMRNFAEHNGLLESLPNGDATVSRAQEGPEQHTSTVPAMNGLDGHETPVRAYGGCQLPLDRRKDSN